MAKNTGRGSRYAANSPTAGQFLKAKQHGGAFKGVHDERRWSDRHPTLSFLALALIIGLTVLLAFLLVEAVL
jgi:hypothetical protein